MTANHPPANASDRKLLDIQTCSFVPRVRRVLRLINNDMHHRRFRTIYTAIVIDQHRTLEMETRERN